MPPTRGATASNLCIQEAEAGGQPEGIPPQTIKNPPVQKADEKFSL